MKHDAAAYSAADSGQHRRTRIGGQSGAGYHAALAQPARDFGTHATDPANTGAHGPYGLSSRANGAAIR
jgi:hypothetical protein